MFRPLFKMWNVTAPVPLSRVIMRHLGGYPLLFALQWTLILSLAGCALVPKPAVRQSPPPETVFQVSTINALLEGLYDGEMTVGQLRSHGDLGIGTFDGLDGEMVLVDGKVYRVRADGRATPVADEEKSPFAAVAFFTPGQTKALRQVQSFTELKGELDKELVNRNIFYMFRIDGTFSYVQTRSVPRQSKPYPPLVKVTAHQPTFEFRDVKGTLVGFWLPDFIGGINVPGYHLHFITADRQAGGHLLECRLQDGKVQVDSSGDLRMVLPANNDFGRADLGRDRKKEVEKVEQ